MGLFFEKSKSTKPFNIIKNVIGIITLFIILIALISSLMTSFDFIYIRLLCILAGLSSITTGIEHYVRRDSKWLYLSDIGFGVIWLLISFIL
jgi:hypothetical protein